MINYTTLYKKKKSIIQANTYYIFRSKMQTHAMPETESHFLRPSMYINK